MGTNMIYSWNWISFEKASKLLGVTVQEVEILISQGKIKTKETGQGTRVVLTSVENFINRKQD